MLFEVPVIPEIFEFFEPFARYECLREIGPSAITYVQRFFIVDNFIWQMRLKLTIITNVFRRLRHTQMHDPFFVSHSYDSLGPILKKEKG